MPELLEQMYCSQQIVIPPKFPYILKRYCKAAIKTQPYDLLRWSFEYFKALSEHRPPPVKLRLEYPVYTTEGGLTRGCLKVLAIQLAGMEIIPIPIVKKAWGGFCLDPHELRRIFCLAEVYLRSETIPYLHFVAIAGGLLTKSLTHTMILLCEALTKEPDGGSAAIPLKDFLIMYKFLAKIDASKDVKYYNGYREGQTPEPEASEEEEVMEEAEEEASFTSEDFWLDVSMEGLQRLPLIDAHVAKTAKLSQRLNKPILGKIERSPSMERLGQIERENYDRERKGQAARSDDIDKKLKELRETSAGQLSQTSAKDESKQKEEVVEKKKEGIEIAVFDEEEKEQPYEFYGEPKEPVVEDEEHSTVKLKTEEVKEDPAQIEKQKIQLLLAEIYQEREERLEDLEMTMEEIEQLVDKFKSANYDLGMVAGRQMSTTSGEFIVQHIEKEIMDFVNEQIAILPDPDLKKKKAKPEEVQMIRELLEQFLDENMDVIVPEIEEVEEEETPIPDITVVYAVPGIGPPVDEEMVNEFEQYILEAGKLQGDLIMPRNIRHFLCPPLEKYLEYDYESGQKSPKDRHRIEEAPTGGAITD